MSRPSGRARSTALLVLSTGLGILLPLQPLPADPLLPQNDGRTHLGASSCRGPVCHSSSAELENVYGDEWFIWHEEDRHSKAYEVLRNGESRQIARNLGLSQDPWNADLCLDCHSDNVPSEHRGPRFQLSAGVGCEACHGGSELWARQHDSGRPHAENVADGMYPADHPVARAALCTSCHYGNKDKFVTHRLMGAGHPRMSFDLHVFTNIQPAHFVVDDDYRARGKRAESGAKVWAIGQAMSVRASLDALLDPKRNRDGVWPELVLYDCHACHHPMSEGRWKPRKSLGDLGPGVPRLNDSSFLMVRYPFRAVDPEGAADFAKNLRELHQATSESAERGQRAAADLRGQIAALIPKLETWQVDEAAIRRVLASLLDDGRSGEFLDYAGAEQASLAVQVLFENLFSLGALSEAKLEAVASENAKLLAAVEDPETYSRAAAVASFERLGALLK